MTIDVSAPGERAVDSVRQREGRRRAATPVGEAFAAALLSTAGIKRKV
jgi:hypothetical protein